MVEVKKMPAFSEKDMKRFWSKILVLSDINDCWEWQTGSITELGYGVFFLNKKGYYGHRVSYYLSFNTDPNLFKVCHKCDNPKCCNPNHLFLGTQQTNRADCVLKGRHNKGQKHGRCVITEEDVIKLRDLYSTGDYSANQLSKIFSISKSQAIRLGKGEGWKHLKMPTIQKMRKYSTPYKLTIEQVLELRSLYIGGKENVNFLVSKFKISREMVYRIAKGRRFNMVLPKAG